MAVILLLLSLSPAARAGDPGPLCDAVAQADAVVEVALTATGTWPPDYQARGWEPPDEAVQPTVDSARVSRVLAGSAQGWVPTRRDLGFHNQSVAWWTHFFAAGQFQALAMLKRDDHGVLRAHGWLADRGDCHVSWCWEDLQAQVRACLEARSGDAPAQPAAGLEPAP